MALHIEFINITTGELLQMEDLNLTERELRWCSEYADWDEVRQTCQQSKLPLGIKEAYRKMDYIARDFLFSTVSRNYPIKIRM